MIYLINLTFVTKNLKTPNDNQHLQVLKDVLRLLEYIVSLSFII